MAPEKRIGEEEPLAERDSDNDFSSGPLAAADDSDEDQLADDEEMLDDEEDEDM